MNFSLLSDRRRVLLLLNLLSGGGKGISVSGTSPITLANAVKGKLKKLLQYGKCSVSDGVITCNNGVLTLVDDELPLGYKRITGMKLDGDTWYDTGEVLKGDDEVTMTLANTSASGQNVFGSYNGTGSGAKNFSLYIYGGGSNSNCYFRYGSNLLRPKFGGNQRTITFGKNGTSGFDTDVAATPDTFETVATAYIGMLPNSSSAAYTGSIMGNILVSDRLKWIPCERVSDGVVGYYETHTETFLEPSGTGSVTKGEYDTSHCTVLAVEGTAETVTVTRSDSTTETVSDIPNLYAVDSLTDEHDIISGKTIRRTEATVYDSSNPPTGRFIGNATDGAVIIEARETLYEDDSMVSFTADEEKPINLISVNFEPVQAGSGDPSPDNVRPISGWTGVDIYNDPAYGGLIKWNQKMTFAPGVSDEYGIRFERKADGSVVANGTATQDAYINLGPTRTEMVGHKLLLQGCPAGGGYSTYYFRDGYNGNQVDREVGHGVIVTGRAKFVGQIQIWAGLTVNNLVFKPQVYDLTEMFGAGNEPATVEAFRELFPKDYYAYDDSYTETCVSAVNGGPYWKVAVTWQDEAGTVYGGYLRINRAGSVYLVGTACRRTLEGANLWKDNGTYKIYQKASMPIGANIAGGAYAKSNICNLFGKVSSTALETKIQFPYGTTSTIYASIPSTVAPADVEFTYELATPVTYHLPSISALKSYDGINHVWHSANGKITVALAEADIVEQGTPQPIRLSDGTNTITVTANVEGIQFDVLYKGNQPEDSAPLNSFSSSSFSSLNNPFNPGLSTMDTEPEDIPLDDQTGDLEDLQEEPEASDIDA